MSVSPEMTAAIATLLGREPRGLKAVAVTSQQGQPQVIRVASLVEGKPFPTLFWLVDAALNYRIDGEEARGLIAHLQARIDVEPDLRDAMSRDHRAHIKLRESYIDAETREDLQRLGFEGVFATRGIGGIADFTRIRCLHTWYAAHLVEPNTVGSLLDAHWAGQQ